jgi:hypothetical protein
MDRYLRDLRTRCLHGEAGNRLQLAVVRQLKIFLFQVGDRFAFGIAHHHANQNHIDAHLKRNRGLVRRYLIFPNTHWRIHFLFTRRRRGRRNHRRQVWRLRQQNQWNSGQKK